MLKYASPLWLWLFSSLAFAQATSEEPPIEPNMGAVWLFFGVLLLLVIWGGWWFWKNSKKPPEEKEGEKF